MTEADFLAIEGIQTKMANKLFTNMQEKYAKASNLDLLTAMNALGEGISRKKLEPLIKEVPDICVSDLGFTESDLRKIIISMPGFSIKTADKILKNLPQCHKMLAELPEKPKIKVKKEKKVDLGFEIIRDVTKDSYVFSGFRNKHLKDELIKLGADIATSVSRRVTHVITKTPEKITGKLSKAEKLNIPILSDSDFKKLLTTAN